VYHNNRIRLPSTSPRRPTADSVAFAKGRSVTVHYDPKQPSESVIDTRYGWTTLLGLLISALSLSGAWYTYRRSRPRSR
jgi:hypothetical protein